LFFEIINYFDGIKVPIPLNILIILISIYLVIAPVISNPDIGFLIAASVILSGLIFYYPFVYRKIELKFISMFTFIILKNLIMKLFYFRKYECIYHTHFRTEEERI